MLTIKSLDQLFIFVSFYMKTDTKRQPVETSHFWSSFHSAKYTEFKKIPSGLVVLWISTG